MSESDGPSPPRPGRHRTVGVGGYRRVVGAHRAPGAPGPTRGYLFTVALLAGTASMPILAAISAGTATVGGTALPSTGLPFIPTPSQGPVVVGPVSPSALVVPPRSPVAGSPSAVPVGGRSPAVDRRPVTRPSAAPTPSGPTPSRTPRPVQSPTPTPAPTPPPATPTPSASGLPVQGPMPTPSCPASSGAACPPSSDPPVVSPSDPGAVSWSSALGGLVTVGALTRSR